MKNPKITILMPVYNGEKYLREAMDSILNQTFSDFEFLIIDGGSMDKSLNIIKSYNDSRIKIIAHKHNKQLIATLNEGIDLAKGKYIARMDCDDVSLPERLEKQVAFMDSHQNVGACGTWAIIIDKDGKETGKYIKAFGEKIILEYWKPSPIIHPSSMIRTSSLGKLRYSEKYIHAEDYGLWSEMSKERMLDNLPEFLICYRIHNENTTNKKRQEQLESSYKIFKEYFSPNLSFELFLSLINESYRINPFKRMFAQIKIIAGKKSFFSYVIRDNAVYSFVWIRKFFSKENE